MEKDQELLSVVLTLKPCFDINEQAQLPTWWGQAVQAQILKIVRLANPTLAESLHADNIRHPFTVSSLLGKFHHGQLLSENTYSVRLTSLTRDLSAILREAVDTEGKLAVGQTIELDYRPFEITDVRLPGNDTAWVDTAGYAAMAASLMIAPEAPPKRITLEFASSTTFKSQEKHLPIPLPGLVFGSLLDCWNAYSPLGLPEDTRFYAGDFLAISRFELKSATVPVKKVGLRTGAVGKVTYTSINYDRYWMSVLNILARFALFAGVGVGTAWGMGQCRPFDERNETQPLNEQRIVEA